MEKPEKIGSFDWPDEIEVADGYDTKTEPDMTRRNIMFLAEKYNELIDYLNEVK